MSMARATWIEESGSHRISRIHFGVRRTCTAMPEIGSGESAGPSKNMSSWIWSRGAEKGGPSGSIEGPEAGGTSAARGVKPAAPSTASEEGVVGETVASKGSALVGGGKGGGGMA